MISFRRLAIAIAVVIVATSCDLSKLAKASRDIKIESIDKVGLKGFSAIEAAVTLSNNSKYTLGMEDALVTIFIDGERVAKVRQVGSVESHTMSREVIRSLWRIESVEGAAIFTLGARIAQRDASGMTIDIEADITIDGGKQRLSRRGLDIERILAMLK